METRITIGIITCGRPDKVSQCLNSIYNNVNLGYQILVVDSKVTSKNLELYQASPNTKSITFESPISPSAARKLVAENAVTPYILFLDDDIQVTKGSIPRMIEYLETHPEVDIVGGAWLEKGKFRELGQYFNLGIVENKQVIYKSFLSLPEVIKLNLESVQADGIQATMLARRKVFDKVQFDPKYGFYFELFDFFLQCKQQNIRIDALPDVIFEHYPGAYTVPTLRQQSDRFDDRQKFIDKWGMYPIGSLAGHLSSTAPIRSNKILKLAKFFKLKKHGG